VRRHATYPPKILIVIESLGRGGAERALLYLLPALQAHGFRFEVAALWPPYTLATELEAAGIPVHRTDVRPKWNVAKGVGAVANLARPGNFDVIHAHVFFAAFYTALSKPFVAAPKRAVTFHNLAYDSYPANNWKRKALKSANRFLMRTFMDAWTAVSPVVAEHYCHHLGLENVAVIPNAVHLEKVTALSTHDRREILTGFNMDPNQFVLLMASRCVHEKGHRFLLQALRNLSDKEIRPQTLMVGGGPLFEEIGRTIKSLGLEGHVRLTDSVAHERLLKIMQASDALVMASTHEGFPLVPAEAMLLRKPVLATTAGGLTDLIANNVSGILVPPSDPEALAQGIERLVGDSELRTRLGEAGRERVLAKFSLEALLPNWEKFYASLVEG
jgi:glycosyltransferase involved in cell wall biosynthesis